MPTTPTVDQVRAIYTNEEASDATTGDAYTQGFIDEAQVWLENAGKQGNDCLTPLLDPLGTMVWSYTAAHLMAVRDQGSSGATVSRSLGDASRTYVSLDKADSFQSTAFGRQALALGGPCLKAAFTAGARRPMLRVLGNECP